MTKLTEDILERAESYLEGKITKEALRENNGVPLTDQEVEELLRLVQTYKGAIRQRALKQNLTEIHEEFAGKNQRPDRRIWWFSGAAAVLLLIMTLSGLFNVSKVAFEDYFQPYPYLINARDLSDTDFQKAIDAYLSGNFPEADRIFRTLKMDSLNHDFYFYRAMSAMAVEDFAQAITTLELIHESPTNPYAQQTRWYLALAYWQVEENSESVELLQRIATKEYAYGQAQVLLKDLLKK